MADENLEDSQGKLPPKISFNGNADLPPAEAIPVPEDEGIRPAPPPDLSDMAQTARIDVAAELPPSPDLAPPDAKKTTARIDAQVEKPRKRPSRSRAGAKSSTDAIRITEDAILPAPEDDLSDLAQTVRIELAVQPPPSTAYGPGVTPEDTKRTTARIETAAGISPISDSDKMEAAKKSTVRVQIDEEKAKGDTARMNVGRIFVGPEEKKKTARIDLGEVLEGEEDIFKRRTALLDASKFGATTEAPGAPRTIRIKRPEPAVAPAISPTDETAPPAPAMAPETAKKSETARIELPPEATEQPPTRRKTIRIKRPEGTITSKPLVITRATEAAKPAVTVGAEEEASPVFSIAALVALLVTVAVMVMQYLTLRSYSQF